MMGIADWFVRLFARQLRRLGPDQLRDLIRDADDVFTLKMIQAHIVGGDFMFWHSVMAFKKELLDEIAKRLYELGVFQ